MNRNLEIRKSIDWIAVSLFLTIAVIGLFTIFSATYTQVDNSLSFFDKIMKTQYGRQALWLSISGLIAFLICNMEGRFFEVLSIPSFIISTILIFVTIIIAAGTKGADAWIDFGAFKLQPCEFMKIATCLVLAKFLSMHDFKYNSMKDRFIGYAILLFPIVIIILQRDTGSALVFPFLIFVLFRAGVVKGVYILIVVLLAFSSIFALRLGTLSTIAIILALGVLGLVFLKQWKPIMYLIAILILASLIFFICDKLMFQPKNFSFWTISWDTEGVDNDSYFVRASIIQSLLLIVPILVLGIVYYFKKQERVLFVSLLIVCCAFSSIMSQVVINYIPNHQQKRIHLFLGMIDDPKGIGWDPNQIEIAIGSGGAAGKGFLQSTQVRNKFISEESTDFIFCTIAEEHGFVGSFIVLSLYLALLLRIIFMAERQRSRFSMYYGYGVAFVLFSHIFINLGMQLKLLPIIGIPLPLISYGGSSCIAFFILFFIFIRLDSERQKLL